MTRRRSLAWAAAVAAALLLAAVFSPGPIARRLLPRLHPGGGTLSARAVGGDLIRGIVLADVRYRRPGLDVTVRRLRLRPSWHALLRRHLAIASLEADSPRVRVEPARAPPRRASRSGWTLSVKRFELSDGAVEVVSSSGTRRAQEVAARGSLRRGALLLERASARALGFTWRVRGRVASDTTTLQVSLSGPATGQLRLSGSLADFRLEGLGHWRGARWTALGSYSGGRWAVRAGLAGLALEGARPLWLALAGGGRGTGLADADAVFDVSAFEPDGPQARGRVAVSSGTASFAVAFSSGLRGTLAGRALLAERSFSARWRVSGTQPLARLGLCARELAVRGEASGRWGEERWRLRARARGLSSKRASARSLALSASGRAGGAVAARLSAAGLRSGRLALRTLEVRAGGTADSHAFSFQVDAGTAAASGGGRGRWRGGLWTARWTRLDVSKPRVMRLDAPFSTSVGRKVFEVSGLSLSGERESHVAWTARERGARWPRFSLKARFDLQTLFELGLMRSPTSGRVALAADLSGDLHAPSGRASLDITHARLAEIDAGSATVRASFDGRVARLRRFDWQLGRGRAVLSGTVPLKLHDNRDFALRIQARDLGLAAFTRRLTAVVPTKPVLDADVTLTREGGRWALRGRGEARVATLTIPSAGLALGASRAAFEARGDRLVITGGDLKAPGKDAQAALSGWISPDGPALRVSARGVRVDTGQGMSGDADGEVAITGAWSAPDIDGTVRVRRGELAPLTGRQKRAIDRRQGELAQEPRRASAASVDLRLLFDRDVWYRERATAIELKGDVRLRKKPHEPLQLLGTVDTVRGDYVYFSRVFKVESGSLKLAGETPMDAVVSARARYVDDATRTKVNLSLSGTLARPKLSLSSDPPMDERDIVSFLATGRPLYEVGGVEGKQVGGTAEAASVIADYLSQGLRRYLPPRLALDVFRLEAQRGQPGLTVGRYITRRLFVTYGQTTGAEGGHKVDATYTFSPHWSVETQSTSQHTGAGGSGTAGTTDNIVDFIFSLGFH